MPGYVPLNNVILGSTADANYQSVTGPSGGSFRKFDASAVTVYNAYNVDAQNFKILKHGTSDNIYINFDISASGQTNAQVGTEILLYTTSGLVTIAFTGGTLRPAVKNVLRSGRLYRLLKTGDLEWALSGNASQSYEIPYYDCNDDFVGYVYQLDENGTFNDTLTVYGDQQGSYLFNGGPIVIDTIPYNVVSGSATVTTCEPTAYEYVGTDCALSALSIYTTGDVFNINDTAYTDNNLANPYTGSFIYSDTVYYYTSGSGTQYSYAYTGTDCDTNPLTIYTGSSSFSVSDTAYTNSCLNTAYSGAFIYAAQTYVYSGGEGSIVAVYPYNGTDCSSNPVTIYTGNSSFSVMNTAYADFCLVTPYTGTFVYGGNNYSYSSGSGSIITTYSYYGADCDGNGITLYTLNSIFNINDYAYTDPCALNLYTGGFYYSGTVYTYNSGVGTQVSYYSYQFYDMGGPVTLYTNASGLNILDDSIIVNYRWKTSNVAPVAPCNNQSDPPNNTAYYRYYDPVYLTYTNPVCFTNGYVTSFNSNCT